MKSMPDAPADIGDQDRMLLELLHEGTTQSNDGSGNKEDVDKEEDVNRESHSLKKRLSRTNSQRRWRLYIRIRMLADGNATFGNPGILAARPNRDASLGQWGYGISR